MPKIEIALSGRTRSVDARVADYLVKKGRGAYVTRDLRAAPVAQPAAVVVAPAVAAAPAGAPSVSAPATAPAAVVETPKSVVSTAEAKARREASKQK